MDIQRTPEERGHQGRGNVFVPEEIESNTVEILTAECCWFCHRGFDHYHHTQYHPEKAIPVCQTCHSRIHHEDGFHDELKPDEKREEALGRTRIRDAREKLENKIDEVKSKCGGEHEFIQICVHCQMSRKRLEHLGFWGGEGGE